MSDFTESFHQLTAFVISQLAAFLQLKDRGNDCAQSLFSTHPTTMIIAISSSMLYYVFHVILLRSPVSRFTAVAQLLFVWFAYAAASAFAAVLLPAWVSSFVCLIFVLLSTGEFFSLIGDKLVIEDVNEDEDDDGDGDIWRFRVCRKRVCKFCGSVAKFFGHQPQPILPIRTGPFNPILAEVGYD